VVGELRNLAKIGVVLRVGGTMKWDLEAAVAAVLLAGSLLGWAISALMFRSKLLQ
jgi:hypothetical protein